MFFPPYAVYDKSIKVGFPYLNIFILKRWDIRNLNAFFYESVNKKVLSWIKYERFHSFHTIILTFFDLFHQYSSIKNNLEFFNLILAKTTSPKNARNYRFG
ncbi:hypothetical protein CN354_07820 [Bacillus cereus]|nr:hypothetical protein CN354_07820 [Bacillus cereus]